MAQAADFTIADVLAWARTKPADETYNFCDPTGCALCQFLRETGRAKDPHVIPDYWYDGFFAQTFPLPDGLNDALNAGLTHWSFGGLVERLEALCPEVPVPPSEWTRLDAYMTDIELASA